jgi:uncharacterized protein (TIGR02996 family)
MNDEAGFLNALRANPEDIETRLVYADWLEERGDPRHELIRLEVEAERIRNRRLQIGNIALPDWRQTIGLGRTFHLASLDLHCEIMLNSGRAINLEWIHQQRTYDDPPLLGIPRATNDERIDYSMRVAQGYCAEGHQPYLIPPTRRDYLREPGDMTDFKRRWPNKNWDRLPAIGCLAVFSSTPVEGSGDVSVLTVVWYQDGFAMPILEPAWGYLRKIPWESVALNTDWFSIPRIGA